MAISGWIILMLWAFDTSESFSLEMETTYLGKEVVIGKDTLTIVQYSNWDGYFTLNNNKEISKKYIQNYFSK